MRGMAGEEWYIASYGEAGHGKAWTGALRQGRAWQAWNCQKGDIYMVYQWKVPLYKVPAQIAGEHIQKLADEHGEVTPMILLEDARPEGSVLHPCYEWDDTKAAEKYRLHQSKLIIANLTVVSINDSEEIRPTNAFVTINERNERASYVSVVQALSNKETKEQVIRNAKAELNMFKQKYQNLVDLSKLLKDFLSELELET